MLFSHFSTYLQKLESTPSRLAMTEILAELFKELSGQKELFEKKDVEESVGEKRGKYNLIANSQISQACYLMQGRLVPSYESLEFQLSVKMVIRALVKLERELASGSEKKSAQSAEPVQTATASSLFAEVDKSFAGSELDLLQENTTKRYKKLGDIGLLAEEIVGSMEYGVLTDISDTKISSKTQTTQLPINQVYQDLAEIAREGGSGSQERKLDLLVSLFKKLDAVSAKFVARIIIGKLRLGFSTMTMFDALSWAKYEDKSFSKNLEMAYQKKADIGKLAEIYLLNKDNNLDQKILDGYALEVGVPVVPALCQRLNSAAEIIDKMGEVYAEPKYDGLRVQIHFRRDGFEDGSKVRAYTRNLENVSHMFPELNQLEDFTKADALILDSEAIGYDTESDELLPFQETITRKRKHNIEATSKKVPIRFFVFDVLYLDGRGLISTPLAERKELLKNLFTGGKTFMVAPFIITKDPVLLREYHEEQLLLGLEGAVMKKISSNYLGGRKGWRWVKIKEEEGTSGKLKDTLDVVVMGYYLGRGKRSQFGIGALLAGVLSGGEVVKTIAKIGTGLTEDRLVSLKKKCDELHSSQKPNNYEVDDTLIPDIWVHPDLVIEVAADEITRSPNHTAGVALRFPRLITVREDKSWQDATTVEELGGF